MGLVGTRWRLAEDGSPHRVMRKCCQCGNVASSHLANFQLGIEIGGVWRGERRFDIILG